MPASVSLAHDPEELGGTPLTDPFGQNFWFFANFQTAQNPTNAANTHVTSSDIAFWGDLAYVGDYGGFRIFDISRPEPQLVSDVRCYGPQGDPSVFDRDGDGRADTLVLSVDSVLAGPQCGAGPVEQEPATGEYPDGAWEGVRDLRHLRPGGAGADRDRLPGLRLAHEHAAARAATASRCTCSTRATRSARARPAARSAPSRAARSTTASSRSSRCRSATRRPRASSTELPVVYPGDADGDLQAGDRARHRRAARRLPRLPRPERVPGARASSARPAASRRRSGTSTAGPACRTRRNPRWAYDQPNVDFWHSATFSWDGKIANFIDESFGDGCPTVTTKTGGRRAARKVFETGNMFFFETRSGELLSEYRNPRPTNDDIEPDHRQVLLLAPRHPGAGEGPLPAGQRVLPRRLVGDRLQRPDAAEGDRVRRHGRAPTRGRPTPTRAARASRAASRSTPTTA